MEINMEEVQRFIKDAGVYYLATVEENKPILLISGTRLSPIKR